MTHVIAGGGEGWGGIDTGVGQAGGRGERECGAFGVASCEKRTVAISGLAVVGRG